MGSNLQKQKKQDLIKQANTFKSEQNSLLYTNRIIHKKFDKQRNFLDLYKQANNWQEILLSRDWTELRILNLSNCFIDDEKIKLLSQLKWVQLEQLNLANNLLSANAIESTVLQVRCQNIKILTLSNNYIGDEGFEILTAALSHRLEQLWLYQCALTSRSIQVMVDGSFYHLTRLVIGHNRLGSAGMKLLSKTNLPLLQILNISKCQIGQEGLKHLIKSDWPQLSQLNINWNKISLEGFKSLSLSGWKNRQLWIGEQEGICVAGLVLQDCKLLIRYLIKNKELKCLIHLMFGDKFIKQ